MRPLERVGPAASCKDAAPAATLTSVKVRRRRADRVDAADRKAGDLTQQPALAAAPSNVQSAPLPASAAEPAAVAPPPRSDSPSTAAPMHAAAAPPVNGACAPATAGIDGRRREDAAAAAVPKDIYAYWSRLKNGRRFPSRHDLDAPCIALHWPNALLLTCRSAHAHAEREIAITGATRFGDAMVSPDGSGGEIVVTPAITEWILAIGREAARVAAPLQDQESFPLAAGNVAYGIVALPLSDDQNEIDHVLCHIRRT